VARERPQGFSWAVRRAANQDQPLAGGKRTISYCCRRHKAVTDEGKTGTILSNISRI